MTHPDAVKTVSNMWVHALLIGGEHQGVDRRKVIEEAGLDEQLLSNPYGRISLRQMMMVWRAAEALSDQQDFGLLMGEQVKPSHFQLFAVSLMHSETLAAAFEKSIRYSRLVSDGGEYFLRRAENEAALEYVPQRDDFSRHQIDAVLVLLHSFANWLTCKTLPLLRVECVHAAPGDLVNYQRLFSAPVIFNAPRNALVFAPEILEEPLSLGDENLAAMHEQLLEQQMNLLLQPDTATVVEHMLLSSQPLIIERDDIASQLNISSRTLQRKLQDSNSSFQQLLEGERKRRAQHLLAQSDLSLTAISEQLGFAESSAFSRAFKRWFALSPLEYRQQKKEE